MSVAYAVGFWICVMRALQVGPAGPTATINNMAMAAGDWQLKVELVDCEGLDPPADAETRAMPPGPGQP